MSEQVACKECKFCKFDWCSPFSWGSEYAYKCTKELTDELKEWSPVTGTIKVTEKHFPGCTMQRREFGPCGIDGKLWEPKYEKDLFKYIKRS